MDDDRQWKDWDETGRKNNGVDSRDEVNHILSSPLS